jgi:putative oxidoreductase
VQTSYVALDAHLLWIALLGWYAVRGAGAISFDAALGGLARSALPFAARLTRVLDAVTRRAEPWYELALRLWLAAALAVAALAATGEMALVAAALPWKSALAFPAALALACVPLLAIGGATRFAGIALVVAALVGVASETQAAALAYWALLGLLFVVRGAGPISLDAAVRAFLARRYPELDGDLGYELETAPRVVIVGAGFGGLACATSLRHTPVQITLVDRHNYHLFQPLLYQVATASLAPGDIATPIRGLFRDQPNARVMLGEVTGVDPGTGEVRIGERRLPYDYLVLASGARHSYFGRDDWEPHAPGLKQVEDATEVRRRLLVAFERAENTDDLEERRALLTFAIVGGGPTGVELAGAIAEIARFGMAKEFRNFDPAEARVLLIQAAPRILPTFPEILSERAKRSLEALGVEVMLNSLVEAVDDQGVQVSGRRIAARTVLWAAGVVASSAARWLGTAAERDGRIKVEHDLTVPGLPNVFAIGDTAAANAWQGKLVPGLAPAAKQGGNYVADVIRARVCGMRPPGPFEYLHLGSLATIGRKAAVVDLGFVKLWGAIAWWLWGLLHVGFLAGFRNRVSVMLDWFWSYLTFKGGTRLITGGGSRPAN